jgi:hypothetical protein
METHPTISSRPFEVTYKTNLGKVLHKHKPQQFAARALTRDIQSIRLPNSYKNQKHLPGYFWMSRMKDLVAYESRLEMIILLQLDFNKSVRHVVSQPFVLHYQENNRIYRHTPDFLAVYDNGAAEVINVKPRQFIHLERNRRAFSACKDAAIQMGWAYSTRCEIEPVFLRNLKWLGGYRRPPVGLCKYGPQLINAVSEPVPIGKAIKAVDGSPIMIRPVLFHLLWTGILEGDLYSRMTDNTLLNVSAIGRKS